jgi:hypothetical protein
MANRPKVTEPVTDNKERAHEQNRQTGSRTAGPSRAAEKGSGGGHEKKAGRQAPKKGG